MAKVFCVVINNYLTTSFSECKYVSSVIQHLKILNINVQSLRGSSVLIHLVFWMMTRGKSSCLASACHLPQKGIEYYISIAKINLTSDKSP